MTFAKDFKKFLKSQQCKMIGCIFLVLLVSIMIKLSMPDTFEYFDYSFKLKFTPDDPSKDKFKISQFTFSVNGEVGDLDDKTSEITFKMAKPSNIKLSITPEDAIKSQIKSITIKGVTSSSPDHYDFSISDDDSLKTITMTVNTDE